jgi:hypothetical protein
LFGLNLSRLKSIRVNPLKRAWILSVIIVSFIALWPVEYRITRLAFIVGASFCWLGALVLCWDRKSVRVALFGLASIPLLALCLPGRPVDKSALALDYSRALRSFSGVRYVWGGEGFLGIDCSGLARKALIHAQILNGFRNLNGGPIRDAISLWWHDCSALALKDNFRNWTQPLFRSDNLRSANYEHLKPGDMAVTADGVHVLIYLGAKKWIEADPNENKVIELTSSAENIWLEVPVVFVRWVWLSSK